MSSRGIAGSGVALRGMGPCSLPAFVEDFAVALTEAADGTSSTSAVSAFDVAASVSAFSSDVFRLFRVKRASMRD